jgi:osmotically-inducible protein OsmY
VLSSTNDERPSSREEPHETPSRILRDRRACAGVRDAGPGGSPDADNTARNARDREAPALTPTDQGESASDREITQQVRQAVVAHDDLSMNAKNAKIITRDGVVTLRGPVKSPAEKTRIGALAAKAPGVKRVDNQLEIENER